jgi:hypothetical protein
MSKDEQIQYLRDVLDQIHTCAFDHPDQPFMDYIRHKCEDALKTVNRPETEVNTDE